MNPIENQNSILWKYQSPAIIYYHMVSEKAPPYYPNGLINPMDFLKQIKILKKHFNIISLAEAVERAKEKKSLEKSLVITIDDGFSQCYSTIAPIFTDEKIPATFFLIESCIDNQHMMWKHQLEFLQQTLSQTKRNAIIKEFLGKNTNQTNFMTLSQKWTMNEKDENTRQIWDLSEKEPLTIWLQNYQPYMTIQQIKELNNNGFAIGSHSSTHPSCDLLNYDELHKEIVDSCISLSKKINTNVTYFSYPFGRRPKRHYEEKIVQSSSLQCLIGGKPKLLRKNNLPYWDAYNFERKYSNLLYYLIVNSLSIK